MNLPFKRNTQSHRLNATKTAGVRSRLIFFADCALIIFAALSVSAAGAWAWQATRVITREDPSANYQVRLQIVNASGQRGITKIVEKRIEDYGDGLIEVSVVDTDDLNATRLARSFVISRDGIVESAAGLEMRLGIPPKGITTRQMDHNNRQITATLVLGEDWHRLSLPNL